MLKVFFGPLLFLGLALLALVGPAEEEECAKVHEVQITFDDATGFKSQTVVIQVGDCVRLVNVHLIDHSVVAVERSFRAGMLQTGADANVKFIKPGVYPYFCGTHSPPKARSSSSLETSSIVEAIWPSGNRSRTKAVRAQKPSPRSLSRSGERVTRAAVAPGRELRRDRPLTY
jgi:plastocyanin